MVTPTRPGKRDRACRNLKIGKRLELFVELENLRQIFRISEKKNKELETTQ